MHNVGICLVPMVLAACLACHAHRATNDSAQGDIARRSSRDPCWAEGDDGRSCDHPIQLKGSKRGCDKGAAQRAWLDAHYPGWTLLRGAYGHDFYDEYDNNYDHPAFLEDEPNAYMTWEIRLPNGETVNICFNIGRY